SEVLSLILAYYYSSACFFSLPSFFFFLYSYCFHLHLHSFPTRRSSDLADATHVHDGYTWRRVVRVNAKTVTVTTAYSWTDRLPLDRKSTRLNSSHVKISYAVFCLKKKKILILGEVTKTIIERSSRYYSS